MDDASPDGTQDIARQLANVYGEDKIVSAYEKCTATNYSQATRYSNHGLESLDWGRSYLLPSMS